MILTCLWSWVQRVGIHQAVRAEDLNVTCFFADSVFSLAQLISEILWEAQQYQSSDSRHL